MTPERAPLIIGIGSPILGDDGVGIHAVRALKEDARLCHLPALELGTAGLSLLDFIEDHDSLIVIDAIRTGAPPGTVHSLCGEDVTQCVHLGSGHDADLPAVLSLGKKLKGAHMPRDILVIAVEAANLTQFSEDLTPEVKAAIPRVLRTIEAAIEALQ
ncbi:MAG: hydrogenase maturation protease [Planctomycetota bacterium]